MIWKPLQTLNHQARPLSSERYSNSIHLYYMYRGCFFPVTATAIYIIYYSHDSGLRIFLLYLIFKDTAITFCTHTHTCMYMYKHILIYINVRMQLLIEDGYLCKDGCLKSITHYMKAHNCILTSTLPT